MADCCTPGTGFPTGPQLGQIANNTPIIWEEICMIQQAILEAASPCKPCGTVPEMCTIVAGDTPMTFVSGITDIVVKSVTPAIAPAFESQVATAGQTIVNTLVSTIPATSGISFLLVFVNGVQQMEGPTFNFTVTGLNQLTFSDPFLGGETLAIYSYSSGVSIGGGSGYYE